MSDIPASPMPEFRMGLSMAGAVSEGAYSAGVLDYLVEALDAWQAARDQGDPAAPRHALVVEAVAGASAGAQAAALLAIGLRSRFPHVRLRPDEPEPDDVMDNLLYAAWVRGTGVLDLLGTRDGSDVRFKSVLDGTRLDEVADLALGTPARLPPVEGAGRAWVANPLRLAITVTNVEGVALRMKGTASPASLTALRRHADVMRFALGGLGAASGPTALKDERLLAYPANPACLSRDWAPLALAATASAAFPLMLPPRVVEWFTGAYLPVRVPWPPGISQPADANFWPLWPQDVEPTLSYVAVDGGVLDNDPIDIVGDDLRRHDPDGAGKDPGGNARTNRALLMIHPLIDKITVKPPSTAGADMAKPHRMLGGLASAIFAGARGNLVDFALVQGDDCYTRFLIAPTRPGDPNSPTTAALAGSCLGAFGGYLHDDFRRHDWQLGRNNAQYALRNHLTLPVHHPLFADWTDEQREWFAVEGPNGRELPIIPLMPHLFNSAEPVLAWPARRQPTATLGGPLDGRLLAVVKGLLRIYLPRCPVGRFLLLAFWRLVVGKKAREAILAAARKELAAHGL